MGKLLVLGGIMICYLCSTTKCSTSIPFADESFRRLQSGENSDEVVNQCCKREQKFVTVGYGVDNTQLRVDVGECRKICDKPQLKPLKREDFDRYLKKYPNMDPVQIFLALQSRISPKEANSSTLSLEEDLTEEETSITSTLSIALTGSSASCTSSTCHPLSFRREAHFGLGGNFIEVDIIERCDCTKLPESCQKVKKPVRVHVDTPFETVVDMGGCLGLCGDEDTSCRPVRNRTISVEGPNGAQCFQAIEECECTGNCYRIKEYFKVFDFSNVYASSPSPTSLSLSSSFRTLEPSQNSQNNDSVGVGVGTPTSSSLSDNLISPSAEGTMSQQPPLDTPTEPLTKLIDIGRCGGSCSKSKQGHSTTSKCLLWSNGNCVSSLYGGHPTCSPTKFMTHSYTDRKGARHSLYSIVSCGCH